jgi:hypothetical protein
MRFTLGYTHDPMTRKEMVISLSKKQKKKVYHVVNSRGGGNRDESPHTFVRGVRSHSERLHIQRTVTWKQTFRKLWNSNRSSVKFQRNILPPSSGSMRSQISWQLEAGSWMLTLQPWRRTQYILPKHQYAFTRIHGVKAQKTELFITCLLIRICISLCWAQFHLKTCFLKIGVQLLTLSYLNTEVRGLFKVQWCSCITDRTRTLNYYAHLEAIYWKRYFYKIQNIFSWCEWSLKHQITLFLMLM